MEKLKGLLKSKVLGAVAVLAIFVPTAVMAQLSPVLDTQGGLYQIANVSDSATWGTTANAEPGETLTFMVHVHNNVFNTTAKEVRVQASLPKNEVSSYVSRATVSAENASTIAGTVKFDLSTPALVKYVPGSTLLYNHNNELERVMPDGITGAGIEIGNINGCYQYEKWVMFKAKIVKETPPEKKSFYIVAKKYNDTDGDGKHDQSEAWLADWGIRLTGNGITKEYLTNKDGYVTFRDLPAGTYQVTEEQIAGWTNVTPLVQTVTVGDGQNGYVEFGNKQIPETVLTSTPPVSLPVSGPVEAVAGTFAAAGLTGAGFMYRKSRMKLKDSFKRF